MIAFTVAIDSLDYRAVRDATLRALARVYTDTLIRNTEGNLSKAAKLAKMDRSAFRRLVRKGADDGASPTGAEKP